MQRPLAGERRPLGLIGRLSAAVVIALLYVTGTSLLGEQFWLFDLGAHFRPQWVALGALAGMVLSYKRSFGWAALAGLVLVANLVPILPALSPAPDDATTGSTLMVVSLNVRASNEDFASVLAYLEQIDADVVFLHESSRAWERAIGRAELGYRVWVTRPRGFVFGSAVLTKGDVEVSGLRLGAARRASAEARLRLDGRQIILVGTHTLSPTDRVRTELRDDQLRAIGAWVETAPAPVAVFGDYNTSAWSYSVEPLRQAGLRDSMNGQGLQRSWPAHGWGWPFRIPIDHAFVGDEFVIVDRRLGPDVGSDHLPLEVELGLR